MESIGSSDFAKKSVKKGLVDSFGRYARKLRISVTDRCNFRCNFCMPADPVWLPHSEILTFEEIIRVARLLTQMGVSEIRLSGGEPLVRREIEKLVKMLSQISEVSMTSNGALLEESAQLLKDNGLKGVTVSLHSLKPERYGSITGTKDIFGKVLRGIEKAKEVDLKLKINCVIAKGCNEDEVIDFARLAHDGDITVRFIEYMPFDGAKLWDMGRVASGREIIERIETVYSLQMLPREQGSTADLYSFNSGSKGQIGIITSITAPFCRECDRIRLKADGKIVPCLFSSEEYDLKPLLRGAASDEEICEFIANSFWKKSSGVETMIKQHLELKHIRAMHTIGG